MNSEFIIAVHSLVFLAYTNDRMATSDTIAYNVSTHPARVRKVMGCLRKHGFVSTKEGLGGGYQLDCEPDRVTLADVYRAMCPGAIKPSWSSGHPDDEFCMVAGNIKCVMDDIFTGAERQLELYFAGLTVSDVLDRIREAKKAKG